MAKMKFTGVYKHEAFLWIAMMGFFMIPFFMSLIYTFKYGAKIRWEFLTISVAFAVLYHVAQLKYHTVPELRNN